MRSSRQSSLTHRPHLVKLTGDCRGVTAALANLRGSTVPVVAIGGWHGVRCCSARGASSGVRGCEVRASARLSAGGAQRRPPWSGAALLQEAPGEQSGQRADEHWQVAPSPVHGVGSSGGAGSQCQPLERRLAILDSHSQYSMYVQYPVLYTHMKSAYSLACPSTDYSCIHSMIREA